MTVYLDTSAAAKYSPSALLETELRRVAVRQDLAQASVSDVLARVALVDPDRSLFHEAGVLPGATLRSLGASSHRADDWANHPKLAPERDAGWAHAPAAGGLRLHR